MATLFQTSSQLRRMLVFVLLAVVVILVVDNVSRFLNSPANPFSPRLSFYQDATVTLGTIPVPKMVGSSVGKDSKLSFTVEGAFSKFPETALVYTIEKPREKINTIETATTTAKIIGFPSDYTPISTDEISWTNNSDTRTLTFNKVEQKWRLRTKYVFDPFALAPKDIDTNIVTYENAGAAGASSMGFNDQSLQQGKIVAHYALLGSDGLFTSPLDQRSANYVSVDIFRRLKMSLVKSLDKLPGVKREDLPPETDGYVYRLDPLYGSLYGSLHMIVSNKARELEKDVYELDFTNFTYNYANYGIRQMLTADEAWDKVRRGEGALAQLRLDTADYYAQNQSLNVLKFAADATKTEMGYYEPEPWDGFVYPIYIFRGRAETDKGNANFVFFVDAMRR